MVGLTLARGCGGGPCQAFMPEDLSKRLLAQAREQQAELEAEQERQPEAQAAAGSAAGPLRKGLGHAVAEQRRAVRHGHLGTASGAKDDDSDDDGAAGRASGRGGLPGRLDLDDDGDDLPLNEDEGRDEIEATVTVWIRPCTGAGAPRAAGHA